MRTPTPRPHPGYHPRPPPYTMKVVTLLVAWLSWSAGEPLRAALQRRSSQAGVYADAFAGGPFAFVAVPLHAPMPVLHVLYPAPAAPSKPVRRRAPPYNTAMGAPAEQSSQIVPVYAAAMPHGWFAASGPRPRRRPAPTAAPPEETALEVLYARPMASGGYAYSRERTRPSAERAPRPPRKQPVIIRVHKYRVVRDR